MLILNILQATVKTIPTPIRQPLIFPIEELRGVLDSSMPCFRRYSATLPSNNPANPSVIESPTAPPTIAPSTPAKLAPMSARIPKIPVSIAPKMISAPVDVIVLPKSLSGTQGISPRRIIVGPINFELWIVKQIAPTTTREIIITLVTAGIKLCLSMAVSLDFPSHQYPDFFPVILSIFTLMIATVSIGFSGYSNDDFPE